MRITRLHGFDVEDEKCDGCGWRVSKLYVLEDSKENAKKMLNEIGLCAHCICDLLEENDYLIVRDLVKLECPECKRRFLIETNYEGNVTCPYCGELVESN